MIFTDRDFALCATPRIVDRRSRGSFPNAVSFPLVSEEAAERGLIFIPGGLLSPRFFTLIRSLSFYLALAGK
jgi:hypothetical protein